MTLNVNMTKGILTASISLVSAMVTMLVTNNPQYAAQFGLISAVVVSALEYEEEHTT